MKTINLQPGIYQVLEQKGEEFQEKGINSCLDYSYFYPELIKLNNETEARQIEYDKFNVVEIVDGQFSGSFVHAEN